jgi:hypothetical protein
LIHEHCLDEIRSVGSVNDRCPCGAGRIAAGLPLEAPATVADDPVAQPTESSDDDSDDSDDDSSESEPDDESDESD